MNENEFKYEGVTYVSKPSEDCTGCAFEHIGCEGVDRPSCTGIGTPDKLCVIFVEKPKLNKEIEKENKMQETKKYDVSDKSKEYWEIVRNAYAEYQAEVFVDEGWETAMGLNPNHAEDWLYYDWRVKPKNRVVTLEIPGDLGIEYDSSDEAVHGKYYLTFTSENKEVLEKILKEIQKS